MIAAEAADPLARLIAFCGLGLAAVGTWIAVLAYRRDRPDLQLRWSAGEIVPELEVTTVNVGRQPIALATVQVADWREPLWVRLWPLARPFSWLIRRVRGDLIYGSLSFDPEDALTEPRVLKPGDPYVCKTRPPGR